LARIGVCDRSILMKAWMTQATSEESEALKQLLSIPSIREKRILDIGSGRGRFLMALQSHGLQATGVEINPHLRHALIQKGFKVLSPEEFQSGASQYDVLILSHIIEHFGPAELLDFLGSYLKRLSATGHLLILTPLLNPDFYDDYDHVKPYTPGAISQLLSGDAGDQVQTNLPFQVKLKELWFRKTPFRFKFFRAAYLKEGLVIRSINLFLAFLFQLSFRTFGKKDAWIGLFQRTGS